MNVTSIDLNADLGEGYPFDAALMDVVTSANICSGAYIADDDPVRRALSLAAAKGVNVGIHVGYPDVEAFGRVSNFMTPEAFDDALSDQVRTFIVLAKAEGVEVKYLKPHGALYHDLIPESKLWKVVLDVCIWYNWPIVHLAGSPLLDAAEGANGAVHEGFMDRAYQSANALVPRKESNAVITEVPAVLAQAYELAKGQIPLNDGLSHEAKVDTICLHGDTPGAVSLAQSARKFLSSKRIQLAPFA